MSESLIHALGRSGSSGTVGAAPGLARMRNVCALWVLAAALAACSPSADGNAADPAANALEPANAQAPDGPAAEPGPPPGGETNDAAPPPPPPPPAPAGESYTARGQEPGWLIEIGGGEIDYTGNYGETRITVPRPEPEPIANGRRYVTDELTVEIVYERCNDGMSGHGYQHRVTVTAKGETWRGCGGERRPQWDA